MIKVSPRYGEYAPPWLNYEEWENVTPNKLHLWPSGELCGRLAQRLLGAVDFCIEVGALETRRIAGQGGVAWIQLAVHAEPAATGRVDVSPGCVLQITTAELVVRPAAGASDQAPASSSPAHVETWSRSESMVAERSSP